MRLRLGAGISEVDVKRGKFTLRQKWFPTLDDADNLSNSSNVEIWELIWRWARSLGIIAALMVPTGGFVANNTEYSKGQRVGVINKISEKGLFWKTKEGQLSLEGRTSTGDDTGAGVWNFSLDGSEYNGENTDVLYHQIKQAMEQGKRVKLTYKEPLLSWLWRGDTDYFVQSIEPVERK